jgi:hypothetical protein
MSEPLDKLKLVLGSGDMNLEEMIQMYRLLTGREPTPKEIEEARGELEKEE